MSSNPDVVALKWVVGLMNNQAEKAESALVDYSNNPSEKRPLLDCMWAVHQITSTLRALGMKKGEMLTLEMERALNYIYKDKVSGERRKLTMGGLMQALKVLPAYLAHTQNARRDTGQGLEPHINGLRRWLGERPRPQAYFFYTEFPANAGISTDAHPASDDEIKRAAKMMLALYLEMAKTALRRRNVSESMKNVARVARKMQLLFAGTDAERYWFTLIGLCEGIAGGLIQADECIAQIFKTGAFLIKFAAENGAELDERVSFDENVQLMLFYIATCESKPVHISRIRKAFEIDEETLANASRGLVHIDAVMTALTGATHKLESVMEFINSEDLHRAGESPDSEVDATALEGIEAAEYRLDAAGLIDHADSLRHARVKLAELYRGLFRESENQHERAVNEVIRSIVDVKLDVEHKLIHGINSLYSSKDFELRESVVSATFTYMSLVESHLHQILRRKALASAIAKKASNEEGLNKLSLALHRHLNKSESGHEELRQALKEADQGNADVDRLLSLSRDYLNELEQVPDRKAINASLRLLDDISGALCFAGLEREGKIIAQCYNWLAAASKGGSVREDDAFQCCAEAFAQLELHLHRSLLDPLDDTSPMMAIAEKRAAELEQWVNQVSRGSDVANPVLADAENLVQDGEISPEFREIFIEEAEEIAAELTQLAGEWAQSPEVNQVLRDIRRHFHTFKGNGRAVGANILGELGWAAQDMLDCVLDGDLSADRKLQNLVFEIIGELPALIASYRNEGEIDVMNTRQLTNRCFALAKMGADMAPEIISTDGSMRVTDNLVSPLPATGTSSQ